MLLRSSLGAGATKIRQRPRRHVRVAGGNYDGGSCGVDHIGRYNAFLMSCSDQNGMYPSADIRNMVRYARELFLRNMRVKVV